MGENGAVKIDTLLYGLGKKYINNNFRNFRIATTYNVKFIYIYNVHIRCSEVHKKMYTYRLN